MVEVEIYFSDLSKAKQQELLDAVGISEPEEMNWDICPVTVCSFDDGSDAVDYDRRAVEEEYGLEEGILDDMSIREAERFVGEEDGALDRFAEI